jgi:hypothetical protein
MSKRRHSPTEDQYYCPIEDKGYCPTEDKVYCPTEDKSCCPTEDRGYCPTEDKCQHKVSHSHQTNPIQYPSNRKRIPDRL